MASVLEVSVGRKHLDILSQMVPRVCWAGIDHPLRYENPFPIALMSPRIHIPLYTLNKDLYKVYRTRLQIYILKLLLVMENNMEVKRSTRSESIRHDKSIQHGCNSDSVHEGRVHLMEPMNMISDKIIQATYHDACSCAPDEV